MEPPSKLIEHLIEIVCNSLLDCSESLTTKGVLKTLKSNHPELFFKPRSGTYKGKLCFTGNGKINPVLLQLDVPCSSTNYTLALNKQQMDIEVISLRR